MEISAKNFNLKRKKRHQKNISFYKIKINIIIDITSIKLFKN